MPTWLSRWYERLIFCRHDSDILTCPSQNSLYLHHVLTLELSNAFPQRAFANLNLPQRIRYRTRACTQTDALSEEI